MAKILVVTSGKGGVGKTTTSAAIAIDLPVLPPSGARERPLEPEPEVKKPEPAPAPAPAAEPEIRPTRIITSPVRGGQQIYAQGGDLVVTASVSPGAELLADGNIHVYGACLLYTSPSPRD